jgi:hypothetical protein
LRFLHGGGPWRVEIAAMVALPAGITAVTAISAKKTSRYAQRAYPARTSVDVTDPYTSSAVIAIKRWSRQARSTSR